MSFDAAACGTAGLLAAMACFVEGGLHLVWVMAACDVVGEVVHYTCLRISD